MARHCKQAWLPKGNQQHMQSDSLEGFMMCSCGHCSFAQHIAPIGLHEPKTLHHGCCRGVQEMRNAAAARPEKCRQHLRCC